MRRFYVGIAACGCVCAAQADDEHTTPADVAEFAKRQKQMKRRVEHVEAETPWSTNPDCAEHANPTPSAESPNG